MRPFGLKHQRRAFFLFLLFMSTTSFNCCLSYAGAQLDVPPQQFNCSDAFDDMQASEFFHFENIQMYNDRSNLFRLERGDTDTTVGKLLLRLYIPIASSSQREGEWTRIHAVKDADMEKQTAGSGYQHGCLTLIEDGFLGTSQCNFGVDGKFRQQFKVVNGSYLAVRTVEEHVKYMHVSKDAQSIDRFAFSSNPTTKFVVNCESSPYETRFVKLLEKLKSFAMMLLDLSGEGMYSPKTILKDLAIILISTFIFFVIAGFTGGAVQSSTCTRLNSECVITLLLPVFCIVVVLCIYAVKYFPLTLLLYYTSHEKIRRIRAGLSMRASFRRGFAASSGAITPHQQQRSEAAPEQQQTMKRTEQN